MPTDDEGRLSRQEIAALWEQRWGPKTPDDRLDFMRTEAVAMLSLTIPADLIPRAIEKHDDPRDILRAAMWARDERERLEQIVKKGSYEDPRGSWGAGAWFTLFAGIPAALLTGWLVTLVLGLDGKESAQNEIVLLVAAAVMYLLFVRFIKGRDAPR